MPRLFCIRKGRSTRDDEFYGFEARHSKLWTESTALNERYTVSTSPYQDPNWMRQLFSPALVDWLATEPPADFSFELAYGALLGSVEDDDPGADGLAALCEATAHVAERIAPGVRGVAMQINRTGIWPDRLLRARGPGDVRRAGAARRRRRDVADHRLDRRDLGPRRRSASVWYARHARGQGRPPGLGLPERDQGHARPSSTPAAHTTVNEMPLMKLKLELDIPGVGRARSPAAK